MNKKLRVTLEVLQNVAKRREKVSRYEGIHCVKGRM